MYIAWEGLETIFIIPANVSAKSLVENQGWKILNSDKKTKVLVVEDELSTATLLTQGLTNKGYEVRQTHTVVDFIDLLDEYEPDVVLLDQELPDGSGLDVYENIPLDLRPAVLMITAHATVDLTLSFLKAGGGDLITKPVDVLMLDHRIQKVLQQRKLEKSLEESRETNRELLGKLQSIESTVGEEGIAVDYFLEKLTNKEISGLTQEQKEELASEVDSWIASLHSFKSQLD